MHLKNIRQIGFLPQGLKIIKQIETTTCLHVSFGYFWDFGVKLIEQLKSKGLYFKKGPKKLMKQIQISTLGMMWSQEAQAKPLIKYKNHKNLTQFVPCSFCRIFCYNVQPFQSFNPARLDATGTVDVPQAMRAPQKGFQEHRARRTNT